MNCLFIPLPNAREPGDQNPEPRRMSENVISPLFFILDSSREAVYFLLSFLCVHKSPKNTIVLESQEIAPENLSLFLN